MGYEDKLPLLKQAMARIVEGLRPQDRVSVVTYSGNEEVVLEGASGDEKGAIMDAVNDLEANGSTNGQAGLQMAYRVAEANHIPGGVNRIVMASDGDLNVGISSVEELEAFVSEKRGEGTYLSVLGFGTGNYQDAKMEALADNGNGSYHYIDSADEAVRVYERSLVAGAVPVADDVKLQVEFDPAMVESYRLVGYDNRALADEDFRNDAADAGEVCAGSQLTVAYEVVLTEAARSGGRRALARLHGALPACRRGCRPGPARAALRGGPRGLVRRPGRRLVACRCRHRVRHAGPRLPVRRQRLGRPGHTSGRGLRRRPGRHRPRLAPRACRPHSPSSVPGFRLRPLLPRSLGRSARGRFRCSRAVSNRMIKL